MYSIEEFDEAKTKVMKYVIYKRRTEKEIRIKFNSIIKENMLEDIIEYLKEANYINDGEYIERFINECKALKKLSKVEIKYKLLAKGIKKYEIEDFFYENKEELNEYELKSAYNIIVKKQKDMEVEEIKQYLLKKGYNSDNITKAFCEIQQ